MSHTNKSGNQIAFYVIKLDSFIKSLTVSIFMINPRKVRRVGKRAYRQQYCFLTE